MRAKKETMKTQHIHNVEICPKIDIKKLFTIIFHFIGGAAIVPKSDQLQRVGLKYGHDLCKQIIKRCQNTEYFFYFCMLHITLPLFGKVRTFGTVKKRPNRLHKKSLFLSYVYICPYVCILIWMCFHKARERERELQYQVEILVEIQRQSFNLLLRSLSV